jgi:hypothetical protein
VTERAAVMIRAFARFVFGPADMAFNTERCHFVVEVAGEIIFP